METLVVACQTDPLTSQILTAAAALTGARAIVGHGPHCDSANLIVFGATASHLHTPTVDLPPGMETVTPPDNAHRIIVTDSHLHHRGDPLADLARLIDLVTARGRGRIVSLRGCAGGVGATTAALCLAGAGPQAVYVDTTGYGYLSAGLSPTDPVWEYRTGPAGSLVADLAPNAPHQILPTCGGAGVMRAAPSTDLRELRRAFRWIIVDGPTPHADQRVWVADQSPRAVAALTRNWKPGELIVMRRGIPPLQLLDAGCAWVAMPYLGAVNRRIAARLQPGGWRWRAAGRKLWQAVR